MAARMRRVTYPEGHVLLRNLVRSFPVISHGEGVWLWDTDGKKYLDGSSGAFVAGLGHGVREVADAVHAQMLRVGYVNGTQFTSEPTEALARRLTADAPAGLDRAFFLASGSEAVEAALKFARQLWVERGEQQRGRVVARIPSYHGNTLYALSISGRPHYKKYYGPMLSEVVTVSSPYPYRSPVDDYDMHGAQWFADELERKLQEVGPDTIGAFIAEPVIGSSAGAAVPPKGYFPAISEVCRKYGILLISDEILCGTARTGSFFASKLYDFEPDILVMGKAIGGGIVPASAVLVKTAHVDEMKRGTGYFMHAQTYMQMPTITAAGVATLDYIEKYKLVENARATGALLHEELRKQILPLPHVGSVQGVGLMAGVEFVADKATKAPFARSRKIVEKVVNTLFEKGLIVWPNVGQANGVDGDLVMLGPPLTIAPDEVHALVAMLRAGILESLEAV